MQVIAHFVKNTCQILILMYFDIFLQQCKIHGSIHDLIKLEICSEVLFYVFAGYLLDNLINYHVDATSCNVLIILYLV